jgi:hypothetical protein
MADVYGSGSITAAIFLNSALQPSPAFRREQGSVPALLEPERVSARLTDAQADEERLLVRKDFRDALILPERQ